MHYQELLRGIGFLFFLWVPGGLLTYSFRMQGSTDWLFRAAIQLGLGIAFWPLVLLWSSWLTDHGIILRWSPMAARLFVGLICLITLMVVLRGWRERGECYWIRFRRQGNWLVLFLLLFMLAWQTRQYHIQGLILPNWIDSVHHTMIVRLLVDHGKLPPSYAPYIPNSQFSYHWGYHALMAWICWLYGEIDSFAISNYILQFGQVLNILFLFMLYAAGRELFHSRRAGLMAAVLGTFVSWYPAYYVSWGRYPHMVGLLLLVPAAIASWRLISSHSRNIIGWWLITVITISGLVLIHVRITWFLLCLVFLLMLRQVVRKAGGNFLPMLAAGFAIILLCLPWLWTLMTLPRLWQRIWIYDNIQYYRLSVLEIIPWDLVWVPGTHELLALATGGISGLLNWGMPSIWVRTVSICWLLYLITLISWRYWIQTGQGFSKLPFEAFFMLFAWCAFIIMSLNLNLIGLPKLGFMNVGAVAISVFIPICLAAAGLLAWASGVIVPVSWVRGTTSILVFIIGMWGANRMQVIVNPSTILAGKDDVRALHWIRANIPEDAVFAINTRRWLGNTYVGSDGGYWISVLTDRASIVPPALYTLSTSPATAIYINKLLEKWTGTESFADPEILRQLYDRGVTHIYIGEKEGPHISKKLLEAPYLHLLYADGGVYIFQLLQPHSVPIH